MSKELIERMTAVVEGMEAGLDDWPIASQIWEYRQVIAYTEQLKAENASLRAEIAQTEFRNERLVSDYASVQEELSSIRRIHAQNIAIKDAEIARWKTVPMKYRRMEFNAKLQDENAELSKKLTTLQSKSAALVDALEAAYNGLRWWMDSFPLNVTEADNEEMLKLVEALAAFKGEVK